jgi:hypothetical protein
LALKSLVVGLEQEKIKKAKAKSERSFKAFIFGLRFVFGKIVLGRETFPATSPRVGRNLGSCGADAVQPAQKNKCRQGGKII